MIHLKQMTESDMIKILKLIADNYEKFDEKLKDKERCNIIIKTWYSCFKDMPYEVVISAVKKTLLTCKYTPTIAEIRENCTSLVEQKIDMNDLWLEAYNMLKKGIYMTQAEFDNYPYECKKFFGSPYLLKQMSSDENINLDVVRSNFYKRVSELQKRQHEEKLLPQNLQVGAMVSNIANKLSIGE